MMGLVAKLLGLPGLIRSLAARVPSGYWKTLAVLGLLGCVWLVHARAVTSARADERELVNREWRQAYQDMREANRIWRGLAEDRADKIARDIGERHDQTLRGIAARADALRVRGPGQAAVCAGSRRTAGLPGASGEHGAAGGTGADPVAGLRDEEPVAAVPWAALAEAGEGCDANLAEVTAWRAWYEQQRASWDAARAAVKSGQK